MFRSSFLRSFLSCAFSSVNADSWIDSDTYRINSLSLKAWGGAEARRTLLNVYFCLFGFQRHRGSWEDKYILPHDCMERRPGGTHLLANWKCAQLSDLRLWPYLAQYISLQRCWRCLQQHITYNGDCDTRCIGAKILDTSTSSILIIRSSGTAATMNLLKWISVHW